MLKYIYGIIIICFLSSYLFSEEIEYKEINSRSKMAIQRGLTFLAETQNKKGKGYWISDVGYKLNTTYQVSNANKPHVGITALACMAFLANGNLPSRGKYGKNVKEAVDFILRCSNSSSGYISKYGTRMYSHAFATLCLAEVYGMDPSGKIQSALQGAIDLIIKSQNAQGGWRYEPMALDADMSITVCQVQALRAARNIGFRVPKKSIDRALDYIKRSSTYQGAFMYQVLPKMRSRVSFPLTAAGVTALHGTGIYNDTRIDKGLQYMMNNYSSVGPSHYFYYYGHYYAIQAMYTAGHRYWKIWYPRVRDQLLDTQKDNGRWANNAGDIFSTSVAVIILQIPFKYLPIFQK